MILKIISAIEIKPLPARIGLNDHVSSFPDPTIGGLGVMHGMNPIHEVDSVLWGFLFLEPSVFLDKCLLFFNIRLTWNVFGLLVSEFQLMQKACHTFGSILNLERLLYKGADFFCRKIHSAFQMFDKLIQLHITEFARASNVKVPEHFSYASCDIGFVPSPNRSIINQQNLCNFTILVTIIQ